MELFRVGYRGEKRSAAIKFFSMAVLAASFSAAESNAAYAVPGIIGGGDRCTITAPSLDITIGNIAKAPPLNANVSFSCKGYYPIQQGNKVTYCWHIHGQATQLNNSLRSTAYGPAAPGSPARQINFRLYSLDYGVTGQDVYIGSAGGLTRYNITGEARLSGDTDKIDRYTANWSNYVTLKFEDNDISKGFNAGAYNYVGSVLHGTMWQNAVNDPITYLNTCGNALGSDIGGDPNYYQNINFAIKVSSYCNLAVKQNLDFGKVTLLDKQLKAEGIVNVDCSAGTDYKMDIDKGLDYFGDSRHMSNINDHDAAIAYSINQSSFTGTGVGTPQGIDYTIDGIVPIQPTPEGGTYRDTLVITLSKLSQ